MPATPEAADREESIDKFLKGRLYSATVEKAKVRQPAYHDEFCWG